MKRIILLLVCLLFISCSFNKRLYQKGYHIEWRGIKNVSENTSKIVTKRKDTLSQSINLAIDKEKLNSLTASTNNKQINTKGLIQYRRENKFILLKPLILEGDSVVKQQSNEKEKLIRKLSKKSFALGIITLICTILFFLYIITIPTAIICGIIAIRKGRKAIAQMGNDVELNKQYRLKAIKGVKLGMSIFVFLITLVHIAMIVGIAYLAIGGFVFFGLVLGVPEVGEILFIVLGLLAIYGVVRLYLFILEKLFKIIPKKQ
ncbi:MAG: hypothetical protein ACYDCN_06990 [Bacteroidia bacterium]